MSPANTRTLVSAAAVLLCLSCLGPLFGPGGGWVLPSIVAILVAAVCGGIGRSLPARSVTGPVVSLAGGVLLVTAVSAPGVAHLGFIPSGASWSHLSSLVSLGRTDMQTYAPPVAPDDGLILLTVAGVYVVAVATDLLAVTAQRPLLAGLPLFALVAVPASFKPTGLGLAHIGLAALGWLLLVAVDGRERQARWGRPLGRQGAGRATTAGVTSLMAGPAGRVAGFGLVAGLLLPALVPSLHGGIFHPASHCCGGGQARVIEPLVTLDQQLQQQTAEPLLTVTANTPEYLRFVALDNYNDDGFSLATSHAVPGLVQGQLSVPTPGLGPGVKTEQVNDTIAVNSSLADRYLPLPYSPTSVDISGDWQLIPSLRTVFSPDLTTAGLSFTVSSEVPDPTPAQLKTGYDAARTDPATAAQLAADLVVPASVPPILGQVADRVTAKDRTAYDKLFALEQYFTDKKLGGYTYTLRPGLPAGAAGITAFLTTNRSGFCQQFATVFTLMARHLGLPARVAVGLTPGQQIANGTYLVSTADAHAWPEVWFTGVGWVRFEPTPRSDIAEYRPPYLLAPGSVATPKSSPTQAPVTAPTPPAPKGKSKLEPDTPNKPTAGGQLRSGHGVSWHVVGLLAAGLLVLALAAAPGTARALTRRRRLAAAAGTPVETAHALWDELLDTMIDVGIPLVVAETPRATGQRLSRLLMAQARPAGPSPSQRSSDVIDLTDPAALTRGPTASAAPPLESLQRLRSAEESARYARAGSARAEPGLSSDADAVRVALLAGQSRGARMRLAVLPPSTLRQLRQSLRRRPRSVSGRRS